MFSLVSVFRGKV